MQQRLRNITFTEFGRRRGKWTIYLESAAFLFHMSRMQPESSGQRELRVP
jgi:hypothetical protein